MSASPTIRDAVAHARQTLQHAGVGRDEAALDARLLAEHTLGWTSLAVLTGGPEPPPPGFLDRYAALVSRRASREPMAYITGHKEFWNLDFDVSPAVLVPRPETELLVEATLGLRPAPEAPMRIVDACTGSGCVAVALATERPRARITATDLSADALAVAQRNARRHGVWPRVHCVRTDLLAGLAGPFDVVVANPPYVRDIDRPGLQPEVREFEPAIALFGGADGLSIVARLLSQAVTRLALDGLLIFEFGAGQDDAVGELISRTEGLRMLDMKADLAGINRVAVATRD